MPSLLADPREDTWEDLTPEHGKVREAIENKIDSIPGGNQAPSAIVGPYRSGKTQLLYHIFNYAWENGIPALYTDAMSIFRESNQDEDIADWIERKIETELKEIQRGGEPDWLPNWETSREKDEWLEEASGKDFESTDFCLLLVDEVEQAYTQLRRSIEEKNPDPLETDDRNPLRIILDDVSNTHQVWAFGLVSAYEFRGEADAGRFEEFRLPIVRPADVATQLQEANKNPTLATGIWWLARGRIGWVRKLVSECPESMDAIPDWVSTVSDYTFNATSPLDKQVFEELEEQDAASWDDARRTILFLDDCRLKEWTKESDRSIPVSAAIDICTDAISAQGGELEFAGREMIERNCSRLLHAMSPAGTWTDDQIQHPIPISLLFKGEDVEAVLVLLRNLIISFEGSNDARSRVVGLLNSLDEEALRDEWMENIHSHVVNIPSWTVKPNILKTAYPPIAVNPSRLTRNSAKEIQGELSTGIRIQSPIRNRTDHVKTDLRFCPTEEIFELEANRALEPEELNRTHVLFIPEENRDQWTLSDRQKEARKFERLSVEPHGGKVFWDFILQLRKYLDNKGFEDPLSEFVVQQALSVEDDREQRNTIRTLYEQVENVTEETAETRTGQFISEYSHPDSGVPVWGENRLDTDIPFWSYGGSANIPRIGASYGLVLADYVPDEGDPVLNLREQMIEAFDNGLLDKNIFRFKEFLDLALRSDGYSARTVDERELHRDQTGEKHHSIARFCRYVWGLASDDSFGDGQPVDELGEELMDLTRLPDRKEHIDLVENTELSYPQAPALVWGGLLYSYTSRGHSNPGTVLEQISNQLGKVTRNVERLITDVEDKNRILESNKIGRSAKIETNEIESIYRAVKNCRSQLSRLKERFHQGKHDPTVATVFSMIASKFAEAVSSKIEQYNEIQEISLSVVEQARDTYEQLRTNIKGSDLVNQKTSYADSEFVEELDATVSDYFDYHAQAGGARIALNNTDALYEIQHEAQEHKSQLRRWLDNLYKLEDLWEDREDKRHAAIDEINTLISNVEGWS